MSIKPVNHSRKKNTWFSVYKISGESMLPEYKEGDFVIINEIAFFIRHLQIGDVIIFNHPTYGFLIKKIDSVLPEVGFFVSGSHKNSLDSSKLGLIPISEVKGKVVWHIRKPSLRQ
ncbi:MAG: S26 family signal peptidase [Chloroflexota bacterium]